MKGHLFCKEDSLLLNLLSVSKALWFVQRLERLFLEPWDRANSFVCFFKQRGYGEYLFLIFEQNQGATRNLNCDKNIHEGGEEICGVKLLVNSCSWIENVYWS